MATRLRRSIPSDSLGARVRAARWERGMSQAQLAGHELTKGFISQLESSSVRPSIRSLQIIASRLGKSLDYFLGDEPLSVRKRIEFFELAAQAAFERSEWSELERIADEANELELEPPERARFLRWIAYVKLGTGDDEGALSAAEEALRSLDPEHHAADYAWASLVKGAAYLNIGQVAAGVDLFERARDVIDAHEVSDVRLRTRILVSLGTAYRRLNRTTKAVQHYEAALALANRHADLRNVARALMGIAVSLYDSGELDGAIVNYRRALELFRQIADQRFELSVLHSLAAVHLQQGQITEASDYARQCRDRSAEVGDEHMAAVADAELARVALVRGEPDRAIATAQAAERGLERAGDVRQRAGALRTIAAAEHALGRYGDSERHYEAAIEFATTIQMHPDISEYAAEYAQKLRERAEYERAFVYLELARRNAGTPAPV